LCHEGYERDITRSPSIGALALLDPRLEALLDQELRTLIEVLSRLAGELAAAR
jgi:hypothetical protein